MKVKAIIIGLIAGVLLSFLIRSEMTNAWYVLGICSVTITVASFFLEVYFKPLKG